METKYSEIFIDSWNTVIESFCSKRIMSADVQQAKECSGDSDICVLMGIIGDVDGQIFMTMNAKTGKALASDMLGGMEITEVDELVISAVGEFCNMIVGNACSSISLEKDNVDITPPNVVIDNNIPHLSVKSSYNISFLLEDFEAINFNVGVSTPGGEQFAN